MAGHVPGVGALGPTVERFDQWADAQLERLRGAAVADRVFETASRLGDFSVVWHLVNLTRGAVGGPRRRRQIPVLALLIGAESLLVNQGIKRVFGRQRPTIDGDERFAVRTPSTSSFPSGHASAAGFAASTLTAWDGPASALLWWPIAATVATSRAYVRIHHASDVVAGLAVGVALAGLAGRLAWRIDR
jgi:undecaprenyl-diphosphatase